MLSYDKKEIAVGCILKDENTLFRRVDYIGKERIITALGSRTLEEARNSKLVGTSWLQDEINKNQFSLIEYALLGVYDQTGREYHQFDEVEFDGKPRKVFGAIKSRNGDGRDFIIVESKGSIGGWSWEKSTTFQILPIQPSLIGKEVSVTIDNKTYKAKIIE